MYHSWEEQPSAPSSPGEPCRMTNSCAPIDLYYSYVGPAPAAAIGGPRAWVETPGGRFFQVPFSLLTVASPRDEECSNFEHRECHRHMVDFHVTKTRTPSNVPGGKPRRETEKDRRERLDRWDAAIV